MFNVGDRSRHHRAVVLREVYSVNTSYIQTRRMSDSAADPNRETIMLYDLLERSARAALNLQREDGSFPPGQSGAYNEPETPVRTTSHWLTTLSKVYEITGENIFANAANNAADFLLSDEARPHGYTFHARNTEGKDKCDGLVGQAAPIRGLAWAGSVLDRPELLDTAEEVFSFHPFDNQLGLWERVDIDGSLLSFDRTLNHQILFAGAVAHLANEYQSARQTVECFSKLLGVNMEVRSDGIIRHYVRPPTHRTVRTVSSNARHWKLLMNEFLSRLYTYSSGRKRKEIGYHPVNLLGIAHIELNHGLADCRETVWRDLIDTITSSSTISKVNSQNIYYGGMTPGIDIAVALYVLQNACFGEVQQRLETDLQEKYNITSALLSKGTTDPILQAASMSYAVDLPNCLVSI